MTRKFTFLLLALLMLAGLKSFGQQRIPAFFEDFDDSDYLPAD